VDPQRSIHTSAEIKTPERHVVFDSFEDMLDHLPGLSLLVQNAGRNVFLHTYQ
jgi:hypothetical protein